MEDTTHVVLIYNEDSIELDFEGTAPALAREIIRMAFELIDRADMRPVIELPPDEA